MTFNEYALFAARTYKGPTGLTPRLQNAALGLCGEAGEFADGLKKILYPSKPGDGLDGLDALVDELGDVLWYAALLADAIGTTLDDVAGGNIAKLAARHNVTEAG